MIGGDVETTSDLPRAARAMRMLRESMHACARGVTADDLLRGVCDILVSEGGFAKAWAALGSERLLPAEVEWGNEHDPIVRAYATRQLQAEVVDETSVPRLAEAARTGVRAAMVLPLVDYGRMLGVIEIHARDGFVPDEVAVLDELAANVSFGISARRARVELRESERHLHTLLDNFPDFVARFDTRAHLTYVNPAVERAFEVSRDFIGKPLHELPGIPADTAAMLERAIRRAAIERHAHTLEMRFQTPRGLRIYEIRHIPELDEQGQAVGVLAITRDVTERKRADEALMESERAYRSLAEHTPDFIVRWDRNMRRLYVNPAFARTLGQLGETVVGTRLGQGYPPQDRPVLVPRAEQVETAVRRVFETGTRMSMEMQWLDHGQLITQDLRIVPEVGARGEVATVLGIGRDITALKRTERELRTLADNAPDLIARFDAQGRYVFVNKAIERATGIRAESWIGHDVGDLIGLDDHGRRIPAFIPLIKAIGSMSLEPRSVALELELPLGGVESVFDIRLIPELDEQGSLSSILLVARDNTERRALEEQLRQAHKMEAIGQLAGGIAHDFNNLLVVILMQTGLASQRDASPEVMRGALEQITEMTERAAHLTTQLLTFSRRQVAQLIELDLRDIIAKSANLLRGVAGERVAIEVYIRGDLPHVMADPGMIQQILMNLGLNARDAMPSGGRLVVSLETVEVPEKQAAAGPGRSPGPHVCLEVTDTGRGIDAADLPRIFEPFFTTKAAGKGTGLGLATVFGIVQQHKGWMEVESSMDKGTTFRIYFPPAERPTGVAGMPLPPGTRAANRGGGETILLVEDDARVRESVRAMLETYAYRVLDAAAPESALLLPDADLDRVALLLTDLVMPGSMTALQLAETLLAKHPQLKVIYMTGYGADIASKLLRVPGQIVLQKPFAPEDLATCLRRALDESVRR